MRNTRPIQDGHYNTNYGSLPKQHNNISIQGYSSVIESRLESEPINENTQCEYEDQMRTSSQGIILPKAVGPKNVLNFHMINESLNGIKNIKQMKAREHK